MKLPSAILLSVLPSTIVANVDYEFYSSITDSNGLNGTVPSFMRLAKTSVNKLGYATTYITGINVGSAWKPIPSLDGEKLVFVVSPDDVDWTSPNYIAVVDTDGSNLKKLTERRLSGNPNWMRDGSNRITYFTINPGVETSVWLTSVDSKSGEEKELRTDFLDKPKVTGEFLSEQVFDSFDDGSMMALQVTVDTDTLSSVTQPCRLTFDSNYKARCSNFFLEGITWNTSIAYCFVSSSQRYITYLKGFTAPLLAKLCYAEIDLAKNIIRNEICIFDAAEDREVGEQLIWYGKMTQDEKNIMYVYAHGTSSKVYNYNIADASIVPVSGSVVSSMHRYVSPLDYNVAFGGDTTTPPIFSGGVGDDDYEDDDDDYEEDDDYEYDEDDEYDYDDDDDEVDDDVLMKEDDVDFVGIVNDDEYDSPTVSPTFSPTEPEDDEDEEEVLLEGQSMGSLENNRPLPPQISSNTNTEQTVVDNDPFDFFGGKDHTSYGTMNIETPNAAAASSSSTTNGAASSSTVVLEVTEDEMKYAAIGGGIAAFFLLIFLISCSFFVYFRRRVQRAEQTIDADEEERIAFSQDNDDNHGTASSSSGKDGIFLDEPLTTETKGLRNVV